MGALKTTLIGVLSLGSGHLRRLRDGALWGLVSGKAKDKVGIKVIILQCSLAKEVSLLLRLRMAMGGGA